MVKSRCDVYVAPRPSGGYCLMSAGKVWACAVGRGGIGGKLKEGDGVTPLGSWPIRWLYYRADREASPKIELDTRKITPLMGWCDDPHDEAYNTPVALPFEKSHECLWREDHLYDLVLVLGFNDDPVVAGRGSAIFLHIAREDYRPTEGCVALRRQHFHELLAVLSPKSRVIISSLF